MSQPCVVRVFPEPEVTEGLGVTGHDRFVASANVQNHALQHSDDFYNSQISTIVLSISREIDSGSADYG